MVDIFKLVHGKSPITLYFPKLLVLNNQKHKMNLLFIFKKQGHLLEFPNYDKSSYHEEQCLRFLQSGLSFSIFFFTIFVISSQALLKIFHRRNIMFLPFLHTCTINSVRNST